MPLNPPLIGRRGAKARALPIPLLLGAVFDNGGKMTTPKAVPAAVEAYIAELRGACQEISSIWLFGSRANGTERAESDWDLLSFGSEAVLGRLRQRADLERNEFDVLVVIDGDNFKRPWPARTGGGSLLSEWAWHPTSETTATYRATKRGHGEFDVQSFTASARRLWP